MCVCGMLGLSWERGYECGHRLWNPVLYRVGPSCSNLATLHRLAHSFLALFWEQWHRSGGTPLVLEIPLDLRVWLTLKMNDCMDQLQMFVVCVCVNVQFCSQILRLIF